MNVVRKFFVLLVLFLAMCATTPTKDQQTKEQQTNDLEKEVKNKAMLILPDPMYQKFASSLDAVRADPNYQAELDSLNASFDRLDSALVSFGRITGGNTIGLAKTGSIQKGIASAGNPSLTDLWNDVQSSIGTVNNEITSTIGGGSKALFDAGLGFGLGVYGIAKGEIAGSYVLGADGYLQYGAGPETVYDFRHFMKKEFASNCWEGGLSGIAGASIKLEGTIEVGFLWFFDWIGGFESCIDDYLGGAEGISGSLGEGSSIGAALTGAAGGGGSLGGWVDVKGGCDCNNHICFGSPGNMYGLTYSLDLEAGGGAGGAAEPAAAELSGSLSIICVTSGNPNTTISFFDGVPSGGLLYKTAGMRMAYDILSSFSFSQPEGSTKFILGPVSIASCMVAAAEAIIYGCAGDDQSYSPPTCNMSPPSPPVIQDVVAGDGKVTVIWYSVTGATSYNLYYTAGSTVDKTNGIKLTNVKSPKSVTGLTNGTQYTFAVSAVNGAGESGLSNVMTAMPVACTEGAYLCSGVCVSIGTASPELRSMFNLNDESAVQFSEAYAAALDYRHRFKPIDPGLTSAQAHALAQSLYMVLETIPKYKDIWTHPAFNQAMSALSGCPDGTCNLKTALNLFECCETALNGPYCNDWASDYGPCNCP
jgi:hypothetical protein